MIERTPHLGRTQLYLAGMMLFVLVVLIIGLGAAVLAIDAALSGALPVWEGRP